MSCARGKRGSEGLAGSENAVMTGLMTGHHECGECKEVYGSGVVFALAVLFLCCLTCLRVLTMLALFLLILVPPLILVAVVAAAAAAGT